MAHKPARGMCLRLGFHPGRPDPGLRCFPEYHPGTRVCPEVCGETRATQSDARTGHFWPFLVPGGEGRRGHRGLLVSKPLGTGASAREPGSKELLVAAGACLSCHHRPRALRGDGPKPPLPNCPLSCRTPPCDCIFKCYGPASASWGFRGRDLKGAGGC